MWTILFIALAIVYVIGISVCCYTATIENAKFREGGFLNMGYTTCDHRDLTSKDVRRSLIWPLTLLVYIICIIVYLINEILKVFFLIFNFRYAETKAYKAIDRWLSSIL